MSSPTTIRTWWIYFLRGLTSHTKLPCTIFTGVGSSCWQINYMVSIPVTRYLLPGTRLSNSMLMILSQIDTLWPHERFWFLPVSLKLCFIAWIFECHVEVDWWYGASYFLAGVEGFLLSFEPWVVKKYLWVKNYVYGVKRKCLLIWCKFPAPLQVNQGC